MRVVEDFWNKNTLQSVLVANIHYKHTRESVLSTKIHLQHPPCNGSTLLCLPLLFGSLLSVVNSCSAHYFNIVKTFANVVLLPSTEGYFN